MQNQKTVAQNVSFTGGIHKWISKIKNTQQFHGNLSNTINTILDEARKQNITITFEDGKQYTIKELEDILKNTYYEFNNINAHHKKITSTFKKTFNDMQNIDLKAALYNFIKSLTTYLNKIETSVITGPELSSALNLSIYQDGFLMLYINVKDIQNDTVHVSRYLQFNQQRFQPDNPIVWKEILACLGVSNISEIRLSVDDLNMLTNHFLNL